MSTKGIVVYLLTTFSLAVVSVYFFQNHSNASVSDVLRQKNDSEAKVWPDLKFGWRAVLATVIGLLGSACGTVGGVGGGGIFVPMLTLVVGFDTKSAAAISKCMIMGASASSVWFNLRVPHPCREASIIDYDLSLLFQPMLMLGITFGVSLSVIFPYWLITVLIIILFLGTSARSFVKAVNMWKEETALKGATEEKQASASASVLINAEYELMIPDEEKTTMQIVKDNLNIKGISALVAVWVCFLLLQVIKNQTKTCSPMFWVVNSLQLPVALVVFLYECVKLYKESKKRKMDGNSKQICEADMEWSGTNLALCALSGFLGGTVGGLFGSGGGFVLGPLLIEIDVIPQVASATALFVMLFSSSLSVVEFYLLRRFPIPYALYLTGVAGLAGFWGQCLVRKLVTSLGRASIIVFLLSGAIFASALTMGVVGTGKSMWMMKHHEFMGFLDFCNNQ